MLRIMEYPGRIGIALLLFALAGFTLFFNAEAQEINPPQIIAGSPYWTNMDMPEFGRWAQPEIKPDSQGHSYLGYVDKEHGNEATVIRNDGTGWAYVGDPGFSAGQATNITLAVDADDIPFMVFRDGANMNKASVMRFNGTSWEYVGNPGFTPLSVMWPKMVLDSEGMPSVVYSDPGGSINEGIDYSADYVSMMRYNGTTWEYVGERGFLRRGELNAIVFDLALDSNDTPYFAFRSFELTQNRTWVMKFNGTAWDYVGDKEFTGKTGRLELAFDSSDTPYVALDEDKDGDGSYGTSVIRFNGTAWEYMGDPEFTFNSEPKLVFDSEDTPFVAFSDRHNDYSTSVMGYDGTGWNYVGGAGFSPSSYAQQLAVDRNDNLIVAFSNVTAPYKPGVMRFGITDLAVAQVSMDEDGSPTPFALTMYAIDPDEGDTLTWSISGEAAHGTAVATGTGFSQTISYTPTADYNGADSFIVQVSDGVSTDTATVNVTINPVNDPPVISEGSSVEVTMSEDRLPTPFALTLHAADLDAGNTLTWSVSSPAGHGTAVAAGTGTTKSVSYTPHTNYAGADSFVVQVSDGGLTDTITVNVTVTPMPDAPIIAEGTTEGVTMSEDGSPTPFSLTLHANDPDAGDTLTWSISSAASYGAATASGTGTSKAIGYTPTADYGGLDSFVVQVSDGALTDTITIYVTINAINDAPVAVNDSVTTAEDTPVTINPFSNDSDAENGPLSIIAVDDALHGTVFISGTTQIVYAPVANYNGTDSFTYTISDGALADNATINVTVSAVNDAPTIMDVGWVQVGSAGFTPGTASNVSLDLDSNNTPYLVYQDAANSNKASVMRYNGTAWEQVGSAGFSAGAAWYTNLALDSNNTPYVAYMDSENSSKASVMRFNGTAWEQVGSAGFTPDTVGSISLAIDSSDRPYLAYRDHSQSLKASVMRFNGSAWEQVGSAGFTPGALDFYLSMALDSSDRPYVAYRDAANSNRASVMYFNGSAWQNVGSAGFTSGLIEKPVLALDSNDLPYVVYRDYSQGYKASVMRYNGTAWVQVGIAGFTPANTFQVRLALDESNTPYVAYQDYGDSPYQANVMRFNGTTWEFVGEPDFSPGSISSITMALDSSGAPWVAYGDSVNSGASVMRYDDGSELTAITVVMDEDSSPTPFSLTLNASDIEGDGLIWSLSGAASHGTAAANGTGAATAVTYTPTANYNGSDSFIVQVSDDGPGSPADTIVVSVTINPVNDAPVAVDDTVYASENSMAIFLPLGNDTDVDGSLTITALGTPGHGSAIINGAEVRYTPTSFYNGSDSFTYTISDGELTDTGTLFITVTDNQLPVANAGGDQTVTIFDLVTLNGSSSSDPDGDTPLTYSWTQSAGTPAMSLSSQTVAMPTFSATTPGTYTFALVVTDARSMPDNTPDEVTITVNDADSDGDGVNDSVEGNTADSDNDSTLDYLDDDDDGDGIPTIIEGTDDPDEDGIPNYLDEDSDGDTIPDSVEGATNDSPVAVDDTAETDEETAVTISALSNDTDPDDYPVITAVAAPVQGTAVISGTTQIVYTPAHDFTGQDIFTYTLSDGQLTDTGTITVTVNNLPDAPVITEGGMALVTMSEDGDPTPFDLTLHASDPDPDTTLTWSVVDPAAHGSAVAADSGLTQVVAYTPLTNHEGSDSFVVQVSDGALTDTITINVILNAINDAPVASADSATTSEESVVAISPLDNDLDPEGVNLYLTGVDLPQQGTVAIVAATQLVYTPTLDFAGTDVFTYTVSDGELSATGTVTVTVTDIPDAPVITEGASTTVTMSEDGDPTSFDLTLHATDPDADTTLTWSLVDGAVQGTATASGSGPSQVISYTPEADYFGSDSFTVQVSDGALTDMITVNVTISSINDAPTAAAGSDRVVGLDEYVELNGYNSQDADYNLPLQFQWTQTGGSPQMVLTDLGDGTVFFTADTIGIFTFTLAITDSLGLAAETPDDITITVEMLPDSDADGIPDQDEGTGDTDLDGIPDYLDPDSDNDGIPDQEEGNADSDGDGIPDRNESNNNDFDNDGIPDYLDLDSDGDGISDANEGNLDSDGDGVPDLMEPNNLDTDEDGIPNYLDPDSDGDGINDGEEGYLEDSDNDGIPDYLDDEYIFYLPLVFNK